MCALSPVVKTQATAARAATAAADSTAALTVSVEEVVWFEAQVFDHPVAPLRIWAGYFAVLCHAVMRDHDLQASRRVVLTSTAIMGQSYDTKGKREPLWWSALRVGFSGRDYGGELMSLMLDHNLPGPDYVMRALDPTNTRFVCLH